MFHLEQSIASWRGQLNDAGLRAPRVLDELESHLREEFQNQLRSGAEAGQAFAAAVERVGRVDQLKAEFAKVEDAKKMRARENLRRWSVNSVIVFMYLTLFGSWYFGVRSGTLEITTVDVALGAGLIVPILFFRWWGGLLAKFLPVINENWILVVGMGALVLAGALFRFCFPVIAPTNLVHLQIVVLWALSPLMGFGDCVSAWFARCAELRKKSA